MSIPDATTATETAPAGRPLENRTLREQVVDHLREEIVTSRLEPGTELGEVALARSVSAEDHCGRRSDSSRPRVW
jgi:hypothetical protein